VKLLLDTHYVYALGAAWADLSTRERQFFETAAATFVVSAVSIWEMRIKWQARHTYGDRKGPVDPALLLRALEVAELPLLPLEPRHAANTLAVPLEHRDPFDKVLLTQAQEEGLLLLTRDAALAAHPLARTVAALAA
jgi:PIN domain nuclease of toxin-antitoxin system